jgi:hypothetical protein
LDLAVAVVVLLLLAVMEMWVVLVVEDLVEDLLVVQEHQDKVTMVEQVLAQYLHSMVKVLAAAVVLVVEDQMDKYLKVVMVVLDYIQQFQEQSLHILAVVVEVVVAIMAHHPALAV